TRDAAPRQVLAGVAPGEIDLLPRDANHLGRHAVAVAHRLGAEIADARLDRHAAVRLDHEQTVVADRAGDERAGRDAVAAHLRALPLAALRLALVPAEQLLAAIERLLDEGAGRVRALAARVRRPELRLAFRRVDPVDRHFVHSELARRLR